MVLAALALAVAAVLASWPRARLAVLFLLSRNSICSFSQTVGAHAALLEKGEIFDRVKAESRLLDTEGDLELWLTPMGEYWVPARTKPQFLVAEQQWEVYGREGFDVRDGEVVIDCGANVGIFTRRALENGARLVVAVEPSPENVVCLRRNFADELAAGRVILREIGVWDQATVLPLYHGPSSAVDSFVWTWESTPQPAERLEIPVTTIDAIVDELGLEQVDLLKLDVEGAEARAILGARDTIKRYRSRIVFDAEGEDIPAIAEAAYEVEPDYDLVCGPCEDLLTRARPTTAYFR